MSVGRTATIMLLAVASVALAGTAFAADQPTCIDVTSKDWQAKLVPYFGKRACVIGPFSVGADGVFIVTDPPAGPPPYGALISIDMPKVDAARIVREPGTRMAVTGLLLGRSFCRPNPVAKGCDQGDAMFFRYYLHQATFVDGRSGKGASSSHALDHAALTPAIIEALEARIVMPTRVPLSSFVRYYTLAPLKEEGGALYIFGEFERTHPSKGYWTIVPPDWRPAWTDGGCSSLSISVAFDTMKIDGPLCNFG
ncbi:MAG: hypothetical protein SGI91_08000 [Alphaproteobacteria bacterium]|nr:hypothetical protein [Alphaproteobacteria bacterium]